MRDSLWSVAVAGAAGPAPGRNALHHEETLSRSHVSDAPRLTLDRVHARRVDEPELELALDQPQRLDVGPAGRELVSRLPVRAERPVVQVDGDADDRENP